MMLREMISFFAQIIINSIFINPSAPHRRANLFSKLLFLITTIIAYLKNPIFGIVIIVETMIIYIMSTGSFIEPISMLALSSIPAFWMAITGLFFLVLNGHSNPIYFIEIFYKTLLYSFYVMLAASFITPSDISLILKNFTKKITFPYLLWSLIPFQLKDAITSLKIQELKGNTLSSSIFVVFSEQLERADQITMANNSRLDGSIKRYIKKKGNRKFTFLFYFLSALNVIMISLVF